MPLFTCDELTPSLCDLRATNGSLAVRGLEVQYTHYHAVNPDRSKLPIVMVHGGPGWSHHYMLPLKQQACGRDVFSTIRPRWHLGAAGAVVASRRRGSSTSPTIRRR